MRRGPKPDLERQILIMRLYLVNGWTLQKIADSLGVSKQRVHQIVREFIASQEKKEKESK